MLKKNLVVLGKLLVVMLIELLLFGAIGFFLISVGLGERSIVLFCEYLILFTFTVILFHIVRKLEHIKYCIAAIVFGIVLLICGIVSLIIHGSWYVADFRHCIMHSMAIFLGALFNVIKKN